MLFLTPTSPRIKRDPERLVKNEVIYFVQVLDFQCVITGGPNSRYEGRV